MTTGQKVLVGVVIVVVALFVLSVVTRGDDASGPPTSGFVDSLKMRFGASAAVPADELTGSCARDGERIAVAGSCLVDVPAADGVRQLKLHNEGQPVQITARVPLRDGTESIDVDPDADVSVAVDEDGGEVRISCRALTVCQMAVTG